MVAVPAQADPVHPDPVEFGWRMIHNRLKVAVSQMPELLAARAVYLKPQLSCHLSQPGSRFRPGSDCHQVGAAARLQDVKTPHLSSIKEIFVFPIKC
jgi:hypothetical protein